MEELREATNDRAVEIKVLPYCLQTTQERKQMSNLCYRHILSHHKNERKNHLRWVSFWCAYAITIGSILSLMTSMIYVIPAIIGLAYMCLFEAVNKEAFR